MGGSRRAGRGSGGRRADRDEPDTFTAGVADMAARARAHGVPLLVFGLARRLGRRAVRRVATLFGHGPLADCGDAPVVRYQDRSFAVGEVSPDQDRIEAVLGRFTGSDRALLHVGTGSSRLARRYAHAFERIDGITVVADERQVGEALALPNYTVRLCNKYAAELTALPGGYHVLVDNNPSSFACCRRHFDAMMRAYAALLAPGGIVLTERRGLAFHEPYAFGLSWRGWARAGRAVGLTPERVTRTVYGLRRPG